MYQGSICFNAERDISGAPAKQACRKGYNANSAPPVLKVEAGAHNGDSRNDSDDAIGFSYVTFHGFIFQV
jgi:hypothetical protein